MKKNLWSLGQGLACTLKGFDTALAECFRDRLIDLGFLPGQRVTCLVTPKFGAPRLYQVNSAVYSLDDKIARAIEMEESF